MKTPAKLPTPKPEHLATTFHRSFTLVRPAISQILTLALSRSGQDEIEKGISRKTIREQTHLGSVYVEAMPRYAWAMGLLTQDLRLTNFGVYTAHYDSMLMSVGTQWLLHFNISNPFTAGPSFWNEIVGAYFRSGNEFSKSQIDADILAHCEKDTLGKISLETAQQTGTAFLGTYTKADGLGQLHILKKLDSSTEYHVLQPLEVPTWAFAYALISYWERAYTDRLSINLDDLTEPRGLASLFLMGEAALNTVLNELQRHGVVDLFRTEKPYQLLLLSHDKEMVLRRLYGVE